MLQNCQVNFPACCAAPKTISSAQPASAALKGLTALKGPAYRSGWFVVQKDHSEKTSSLVDFVCFSCYFEEDPSASIATLERGSELEIGVLTNLGKVVCDKTEI